VRERDGSEKDLTPGDNLKASFAGWTHAGDAFYIQSNERDPRFFDLYRYETGGYARKLVYKNDGGFQIGDISDDGRWVALAKPRTTADSDISVWNSATNETKLISKHDGVANYSPEAFDPESRALYYTTDDGSEFARVKRYDLSTGKHEEVERADWDIASTFFSHNGRYRVTSVNEDGRSVLRIHDGKTDRLIPIPSLPAGEIGAVRISRSETRLAFQLNEDRGPNNLYVFEFGGKAPRRLTDTLSKDVDAADLVDAQVVRFPSFDGLAIPNIFYKPHQAARLSPALIWVRRTGRPDAALLRPYIQFSQPRLRRDQDQQPGSSGCAKPFYTADDRSGHERSPTVCREKIPGPPLRRPERIGILGQLRRPHDAAALTLQPTCSPSASISSASPTGCHPRSIEVVESLRGAAGDRRPVKDRRMPNVAALTPTRSASP
jgi:hypothetical protein